MDGKGPLLEGRNVRLLVADLGAIGGRLDVGELGGERCDVGGVGGILHVSLQCISAVLELLPQAINAVVHEVSEMSRWGC